VGLQLWGEGGGGRRIIAALGRSASSGRHIGRLNQAKSCSLLVPKSQLVNISQLERKPLSLDTWLRANTWPLTLAASMEAARRLRMQETSAQLLAVSRIKRLSLSRDGSHLAKMCAKL